MGISHNRAWKYMGKKKMLKIRDVEDRMRSNMLN
jgi:hypothetical protein